MVTETQRCPRCTQDLPAESYHPDKWGKRGHYCRECMIEYKREWRERQPRKPSRPPRVRVCASVECVVQVVSGRARCNQHTRTHLEPSTGYRAVHKRIGKTRGKASTHTCIHCGEQAEHWAYDHADTEGVMGPTDRGIVVAYSLDPDHYLPLCRPCHIRFDGKSEAHDDASMPQPKRVSNW